MSAKIYKQQTKKMYGDAIENARIAYEYKKVGEYGNAVLFLRRAYNLMKSARHYLNLYVKYK